MTNEELIAALRLQASLGNQGARKALEDIDNAINTGTSLFVRVVDGTGSVHAAKFGKGPLEEELFLKAVSFCEAASRAAADILVTPLNRRSLTSPSIVCISLSVELYLKLLNQIATGSFRRTHQLGKLFSALPKELQNTLEQRSNGTLSSVLDRAGEAFVSWRYDFEHATLDAQPAALFAAAKILHEGALELRPNLANRLSV